jgi:hypothetical protein
VRETRLESRLTKQVVDMTLVGLSSNVSRILVHLPITGGHVHVKCVIRYNGTVDYPHVHISQAAHGVPPKATQS